MKEKAKDKSGGTALPDFLKYFGNKLSGKERNSFERELQKDPFADEAAEGFTEISPEEAAEDIAQIQKRLKGRVTRKSRMILYRIAASVAALMILSSVYIFFRQPKTNTIVKEIAANSEMLDISRPEPIIKQKAVESPENISVRRTQINHDTFPGLADNLPTGSVGEKQQKIIADNSIKGVELNNTNIVAARSKMAAQVTGTNKAAESRNDTDIILQPSLSELDEVVVVGYGVSKKENAAEEQTGYTAPQPSSGNQSFRKYIEENIHKPASMKEGDREVVIFNIAVNKTGEIGEIKVLRSPGKEFSDEAIRLVKEGPSWKPAELNGEKTDGTIRLRIVFK